MKVTADLIMRKEIPSSAPRTSRSRRFLRIKQTCRYDDFMFTAWFERAALSTEEIEEQMHVFAGRVMPVLRRECGGGPDAAGPPPSSSCRSACRRGSPDRRSDPMTPREGRG